MFCFLHLGLWSILRLFLYLVTLYYLPSFILASFCAQHSSTWTILFKISFTTSLMVINSPRFSFLLFTLFLSENICISFSFSVDVFAGCGILYKWLYLFFRFLKNSIPLFSGFFLISQFHSRLQPFEDTLSFVLGCFFKTLVHFEIIFVRDKLCLDTFFFFFLHLNVQLSSIILKYIFLLQHRQKM